MYLDYTGGINAYFFFPPKEHMSENQAGWKSSRHNPVCTEFCFSCHFVIWWKNYHQRNTSILPTPSVSLLMNENDSEEWLRSSIWDSPAKAAPTQSPGLFPAWMAFLDGITNSTNMNLSKVWEIVEDREAWRASVHPIAKCSTWLRDWTSCPGHGYSTEWGWGYLIISQTFLRLTEWLPALPQSWMPKSLIPNTPESSTHLDLSAVWWLIEFLSIT